MKRAVIGLVAHVDAGKTTLSEAMLFSAGMREKLGRVDKKDSFLDTHAIERERGITVFSKQAVFTYGSTEITLVDTPGHVDFSGETERALTVQDYSVLLVSASEGVTAHTSTLYGLISKRKIPTFIFVNKLDLANRKRIDILDELKRAFGSKVVDFNLETEDKSRFFEECAAADEDLMDDFFSKEEISEEKIAASVRKRRIIPAFFGSALKCEKISVFLSALDRYTVKKPYSDTLLGAKVYKIATDADNSRLTYLKITGGKISVKDTLNYVGRGGKLCSEKIESIRLYSAEKFKALKSAEAGMLVAVTGLSESYSGMGIGVEFSDPSSLEPPLDYKMIFESGIDVYSAYLKIKKLAEEDPSLSLRYDQKAGEIRLKLMGEIQTEVLHQIIKERFGYTVSFGDGSILYKETLAEKTYGAGHFEPLTHYAEVRLRIEPLPLGSGVIVTSDCPEDRLKINWQRQILAHLDGKEHKGILTGSPLTDVKITLIAGRAHPKHTDGGDFREAAFRALRQGLMKSDSILLEPTFDFTLDLPEEHLGRAMTDLAAMNAEYSAPEFSENNARLTGSCPVFTIRGYSQILRSYTHGAGRLTLTPGAYVPCHNSEQIIASYAYSPELDSDVTADSVFCKNGTGYAVAWYDADDKMHTENPEEQRSNSSDGLRTVRSKASSYKGTAEEDKELMKIFESTYGKITRRSVPEKRENSASSEKVCARREKQKEKGEEFIIVDGYNLIFAWDKLKSLANSELGHARDTLIRILSNYRGFKKCNLIVVFDAYKRRDNDGLIEECGGISVVYTKERQTADAYIEKTAYDLAKKHTVKVVTSDYDEQLIILGVGGIRVSTREFIAELELTRDFLTY